MSLFNLAAKCGRLPSAIYRTGTPCIVFSIIMAASRTSSEPYWIETEDWHTAGEPFRIVSTLPPHISTTGSSVRERRLNILSDDSHPLHTLRQTLCHEPRGHADMYGGFITPPDDVGAAFGVLFWHKDGFSTACGHGTIALGCWAVTNGLVKAPQDGAVDVVIDVPSGRVTAKLFMAGGKIVKVEFINVPSFHLSSDIPVKLASGDFTVDLSFGGAVYAHVEAGRFGLAVEPPYYDRFISLGREIKATLGKRGHFGPYDLYGVIFYDRLDNDKAKAKANDDKNITQRNVTVFADGQIDRSPCGSGTASRVASLYAKGELTKQMTLVHHSIVSTTFEARVGEDAKSETEWPGCRPEVYGMAHLVAQCKFYIDAADPTFPGFVFR